jgi:hypothetical protein
MFTGKLHENVLLTAAFETARITAGATVYYNGKSITTGAGIGFDSQPFADAMFSVNIGSVAGTLVTLLNSVLESDTDNPAAATALASATFTSRGSSTTAVKETGAIHCQDTKRYLFLKTEVQGTLTTIDFSAAIIGGNPKEQPTSQALVFNV